MNHTQTQKCDSPRITDAKQALHTLKDLRDSSSADVDPSSVPLAAVINAILQIAEEVEGLKRSLGSHPRSIRPR